MANLALIPDDADAKRSLEYARGILEREGTAFEDMMVVDNQLPVTDFAGRRTEKEFRHTPEPLLRSWRSARRIMAHSKPGDTLLVSDYAGLGAIFAITQRSLPAEQRRNLWTVAADSRFLELRVIGSAHSGLPTPLESVIDWEITQYQFSNRVLATSRRAQIELELIDVGADLLIPEPEKVDSLQAPARNWWVPGPVSRLTQTGEVLRALTSVSAATATVSDRDAEDEIWTGSTWDALRHSRALLGERISRSDQAPPDFEVTVLGNPLAPPPQVSGPVAVPQGSVAALVHPSAPRWSDADELADILSGNAATGSEAAAPSPPLDRGSTIVSAAQLISVGIPVFRDVRFLDECIGSVINQTMSPLEVIVVDDGSASSEVDDKLDQWVKKDHRIRVIRGRHRGVCVARNRALKEMKGDAFVFIDSDDFWEPEFLERCATMLRGDDRLCAVATWTRFFGAYEGIEAKPPFDARTGSRENTIISTAALVDMAVRERGIRFSPDLAFLFCEDWHLWSQIVADCGGMGLVPEALANHRVHESSGGYMRTELAHAIGKTRATDPLRA